MAYSSPLGSNFKLERSLSSQKEEETKETPKKRDYISLDSGFGSNKTFGFVSKKPSNGNRSSLDNQSPKWQNRNFNWKSPKYSQEETSSPSIPISQFFHPSMLEDPWEELEKETKKSS